VAELTPQQAGDILQGMLAKADGQKHAEYTVADAAAAAGIPLRSAELGLRYLSTKYRGTLSVTEQGELIHRFPYGFELPLSKQSWWKTGWQRVKNAVVGAGRFVVRAWVSVVLVGYAVFFAALALALALGSRDERGFAPVYVIMRVVMEALWWTFHPFSPVARRNIYDDSWLDGSDDNDDTTPFYEKVNRFVFGPANEQDPRERERRLVAAIRHGHGRIGVLDALRVTGLSREELDPLLSRLMLDYDGDVHVDDAGAITYSFVQLQKTVQKNRRNQAPRAIWEDKVEAVPITGNEDGSNVWIGLINAFNLGASWLALKTNLTLDRVIDIVTHLRDKLPHAPIPYDGTPWMFGVVPFVFSLLMFALPVYRWTTSNARKAQAAKENAHRAVLKAVFDELHKQGGDPGIREDALKRAWKQATGETPEDKELSRLLAELGADVDMDAMAEGKGIYRFRDLEAEVKALELQREQAKQKQEHQVGDVVFRA
jgi:hypothetical protein